MNVSVRQSATRGRAVAVACRGRSQTAAIPSQSRTCRSGLPCTIPSITCTKYLRTMYLLSTAVLKKTGRAITLQHGCGVNYTSQEGKTALAACLKDAAAACENNSKCQSFSLDPAGWKSVLTLP